MILHHLDPWQYFSLHVHSLVLTFQVIGGNNTLHMSSFKHSFLFIWLASKEWIHSNLHNGWSRTMSCPTNVLNGTLVKLPNPPDDITQSILRMHWVCPEDVHWLAVSKGEHQGYHDPCRLRFRLLFFSSLSFLIPPLWLCTLCKKESQEKSKKMAFSHEKSRKSHKKHWTFHDWKPFFWLFLTFFFTELHPWALYYTPPWLCVSVVLYILEGCPISHQYSVLTHDCDFIQGCVHLYYYKYWLSICSSSLVLSCLYLSANLRTIVSLSSSVSVCWQSLIKSSSDSLELTIVL